MNPSEQRMTDALRSHGYKLTKARRAVIHTLAGAATPLSISDLHQDAQARAIDLGLVTVYRTLELLEELELVRPVHIYENCHGYVIATPGHTHHLVCRCCHTVTEIEGCDLSRFLERVAAQTGYDITGHWLELEGVCPACRSEGCVIPATCRSPR